GQIGELRQELLQHGEDVRELAVYGGYVDGLGTEALLRPEKLCHAIFVGRHAAGDGGVASVNTEGVIMQIRRCGPNANERRRAIEGCGGLELDVVLSRESWLDIWPQVCPAIAFVPM